MTLEANTPPLVRGLQFLFFARAGRVTLAISLIVLFSVVGTVFSLSYRGFCFHEGRFLSTEEYFDAAIQEIIRSDTYVQQISAPGVVRLVALNVIPYKNKEEFRQRNPDCCKIVSYADGPSPTFDERLLGVAAVVVSVTYTVNYMNANGQPDSIPGRSEYAVHNCGRAWDARH